MREIKFRAWNYEHNRMLNMAGYFDHKPYNDPKYYAWMQYTGLKDKNGKEIYEGDILRLTKDFPNFLYYKGKIFQCKYIIAFDTIPGLFFQSNDGLIDINIAKKSVKYEIIGNIYENPEILK